HGVLRGSDVIRRCPVVPTGSRSDQPRLSSPCTISELLHLAGQEWALAAQPRRYVGSLHARQETNRAFRRVGELEAFAASSNSSSRPHFGAHVGSTPSG